MTKFNDNATVTKGDMKARLENEVRDRPNFPYSKPYRDNSSSILCVTWGGYTYLPAEPFLPKEHRAKRIAQVQKHKFHTSVIVKDV